MVRKKAKTESSRENPAERTLGEAADEILEFLGNGRVRDLEEIAGTTKLPVKDVERVLAFLTTTDLVKKGFRITPFGIEFLKLPRE